MEIEIWHTLIPTITAFIGSGMTFGMNYLKILHDDKQRNDDEVKAHQRKLSQIQKNAVKTFFQSLRNLQSEMTSPELNQMVEVSPNHKTLCEEGMRARNEFQRKLFGIWEIMDLDLVDHDVRKASYELGEFLSQQFPVTNFMYDPILGRQSNEKVKFDQLLENLRTTVATTQPNKGSRI
ncbi:hypothetical protein HMPREF2787_04830 [Corynebacterium sp. HMSC061H03]|uniref:hypothetical protein n=1 Tax=Corynebacterium sp. HMSC061H03 TaxID=1739291 RepID=UPI0008A8A75D|nr:hypothetical protein [Corynebacterium sp. HMSC061H03]OHR22849.1 hypothetical protein HMPREF2787_04830 [Corynebacterium sp. HMSC061H03]